MRILLSPGEKEKGMTFIWILFLLVILTVLSLAFIRRISIGTSAVASIGSAMQADYLARAAVNHALWLQLNDPAFSPSGDIYYMHDLGRGRYGYKVRPPTMNRFGSVAAVGAVDNVVKRQSYVQYLKPYNIITAYSRAGESIPQYRKILGARWDTAFDSFDEGASTAPWLVLRGCPVRKEMIMGTLDASNDLNLIVWDGSSWGDRGEFATTANMDVRAYDIAYENLSGDALVVGRHDASEQVSYQIWNGSNWSSRNLAFGTGLTSVLRYLTMASRPGSDEILIAAVSNYRNLKILKWDGSSFTDLGVIDFFLESDRYLCVDIVYEQQSGHALILWAHNNASRIYYSVWNGTSLSGVSVLPDFGAEIHTIRAAADPTSDYVFVAAVDEYRDLNVAVWNGDAWTDSMEVETTTYADYGQIYDVAWEPSGERVLAVWSANGGNNVRYFTWEKGTALADHAVQTGPSLQMTPILIRLLPLWNSAKIIMLGSNSNSELCYCLWTGNTFLGDPGITLESSLDYADINYCPVDVAEWGITYTGGSG